jgi:class 3 adenylate cyclase
VPEIQTATIVFTDLVGSTSLSSSVGPVVAEELRKEHFEVLRAAIEEFGGDEVKNLGDGLMVTFSSTSSAVSCAVAMQQGIVRRNRGANEQLAIRVGIAHGDANRAENDWFGPPVVEAARLCAKAQGDQILLGQLAKMMAAGRDHAFASVGALELKGLPEPVETFEVRWEPADRVPGGIPLPSRLHGVPPLAYAGRRVERERLSALWDAARGGMRQAVMISGEPGIGKTRLASHAALELHGEGATVLLGHCDEDLTAPYGAWVQALTHYVEHAPSTVLDPHVERHGGELGRLVPALHRRVENLAEPTASDPETERYMLFSAVVDLVERAGAHRPLVVLLDDLHWADKPTLALLRHIVSESASMRLLLLGTYRDSDLTRHHPLTDTLADLRAVAGVERMSLTGLDEAEVAEIMAAAAGHEMDVAGLALAREIAAETGGNAFFVGEMLRHLLESGALAQRADGRWELRRELGELGLPQSVREVVGRRIERLGEPARGLLRCAAVLGRDFDVDLLLRVAREDEDQVLDHLEAAVEAAVLIERSEPGRFTFAHALINHTLYDEIGVTRRARLHQRVAEALEEMCGSDPGARIVELAHHTTAASVPIDTGKAVAYSRQAGQRALEELAPDEALRWFTQARDLLERMPDADSGEASELLIGLGEAQRQVGDPAFRETLLEAAGMAEAVGDADRMARAALANNRGVVSAFGLVDDERVAVLERAIELGGESNPERRARLLSLQSVELQFDLDHAPRRALAEEALALAREVGDERTLAYVLRDYWQAHWSCDTLERRQELVAELERLAGRLDDPLVEFAAFYTSTNTAFEAGDVAKAAILLDRWRTFAERVGQPALRWLAAFQSVCLALLRGDFEEAERLIDAAAEIGSASDIPDTITVYVGQLISLRKLQGRADEVFELMEQAAEENAGIPAFRAALSSVLVGRGRVDEGGDMLAAEAAQGFTSIPRDQLFTTTCAFYGETAVLCRTPEAARLLYDLLLPARGQLIANGATGYSSCEVYLGALAATIGRHDLADEHFAAASVTQEREGIRAGEALNQAYWARSLVDRDRPDEARAHAERAFSVAEKHGYGMAGDLARAALEAAGA